MKNLDKLFLILFSILTTCMVGCSDDDDNLPGMDNPVPELKLENESVKVIIGSENKLALKIEQGGGGYNAFSLDESVATVEIDGSTVTIEGLMNGKTSVIVSDDNGYYRKIDVWACMTDSHISLSTHELNMVSLLGHTCSETVEILLGNGFYTVSSDNDNILASLTKEGKIKISGNSKRSVETATVTVTDWSGLTGTIEVSLSSKLEPYTDEELEAIKQNPAVRYNYDKVNLIPAYLLNYTNYINTVENGKQVYGWVVPDYNYSFKLYYLGDKSVGKKENSTLSAMFFANDENGNVGGMFNGEPVTLEIIKNDGTHIWGIYSYVKNEKLHYGYFCDTVDPVVK